MRDVAKMKLQLVALILILRFISVINSSCSLQCKRYVIVTEQSINQTSVDNCTCSLKELVELTSNLNFSVGDKELTFQPGVHYTEGDDRRREQLQFQNIKNVTIRGQPNASVQCNIYFAIFRDVEHIKIQNMHIQRSISWKDLGVHIDVIRLPSSDVEVTDSNFTNLGITFHTLNNHHIMRVTIENTIFENCSHLFTPIMNIENYNVFASETKINIIFKDLKVSYNNRTFITLSGLDLCLITFMGNNLFLHNQYTIIRSIANNRKMSLILSFSRTKVNFFSNIQISDLILSNGNPPIVVENATILFEDSHIVFNKNQGCIVASNTRMTFGDNTTIYFINSIRQNGGALSLDSESVLTFNATKMNVSLHFINNTAERGGAIYVEETSHIKSVFDIQCNTILVKLTFKNNSVLFGGDHIYGGWIDWLEDNTSEVISSQFENMSKILHFESSSDNSSDVASDPVRMCLCQHNNPVCNITNYTVEVHGDAVTLELVAVGQRITPTAAYVRASLQSESSSNFCSGNIEIWHQLSPRQERIQATCTNITYKISVNHNKEIYLQLLSGVNNNYCSDNTENSYNITYKLADSVSAAERHLFQQLTVKVKRKPCPRGFNKNCRGVCTCSEDVNSLNCDSDNITFKRKEDEWIGVVHEHTNPGKNNFGVILYKPCPFDYCRGDTEFLLEDTDVICASNRGGILCGGCKMNFSRVLGSSKCQKCSNNVGRFIAVHLGHMSFGVFLVITLMLLDITVAAGTINGLIFYANIIQIQHTTFFRENTLNSISSTFFAWLNLDQGYEVCLYDGLDEYVITWLKMPTPLYIWFIAAVMIVVSHYSARFSNLIGKNSVQVLATLFLISYTTLFRLIIDVFSFTTVTYPDGYQKKVWFIDGNVDYFKGKHIPLIIATIFYSILTLPYTFILLTVQLLYKVSHYRVMFWVQRLKPFFDAYTAPYKASHRYWTGLLLVTRICLLVTFSTFQSINTSINLLTIILLSFALIGLFSLVKGVYESSLNNFLEIAFLCNLGMTSAAVLFDKRNTKVAVSISTCIAFTIFICIIIYHAQRRLLVTKCGSKLKEVMLAKFIKKGRENFNRDITPLESVGGQLSVASTIVELKEPLLEDEHVSQ